MVQKRFVDPGWVRGVGEGGEPGGFSRGDQLLGRSDVVWGGFREEVGPVGGFGSLDGLEVSELGLSCNAVGVGGPELFGPTGGLCELLSDSGQERGPPSFRPWGRT